MTCIMHRSPTHRLGISESFSPDFSEEIDSINVIIEFKHGGTMHYGIRDTQGLFGTSDHEARSAEWSYF